MPTSNGQPLPHQQQQQQQAMYGGCSPLSAAAAAAAAAAGKVMRPISPATIQCGINDEELVTLSVRDLNRALKMRGLTRDEIVTMKQR